jgi:murein L,D-transpeptidase YcbB/YkuD
LHDTPSKYLFSREKEPLATVVSGSKPAELANKIMEDDTDWNQKKLMKPCMLERKMVHTQKQNSGLYRLFYRLARYRRNFAFYDDIYNRDEASWLIV